MLTNYSVRCDKTMHCVLKVGEARQKTFYIARDGKHIDLHALHTAKFEAQYGMLYQDYPLHEYAQRLFNTSQYGVIVTSRAAAHLHYLTSHKEPSMAKTSAPIPAAATAAIAPTKATKASAAVPAPKAVKEPKAPVEPGEEKAPRNRREKLEADKKIKVLAANPARVGTMRHEIVNTIFQAKTVAEALDSTVTRKDNTEYKIGLPDLYFALENSLIELH